MTFTTGNQQEAVRAESTTYVTVPGAYVGVVKKAEYKTFKSGAEGLEIEVMTEAGTVKDMFITKKKDGTTSDWGVSKIQGGFMRCIGLAEGENVQPQQMPDGTTQFPAFLGKRVGACVNIEITGQKPKTYENTRVEAFYNPDTNVTGSGRPISEIVPLLKREDNSTDIPKAPTTVAAPVHNPFPTAGQPGAAPANPFPTA